MILCVMPYAVSKRVSLIWNLIDEKTERIRGARALASSHTAIDSRDRTQTQDSHFAGQAPLAPYSRRKQ